MIIVLQVNAPLHTAQGVKESLAMFLEQFGDTKVLEIRAEEAQRQQTSLFEVRKGKRNE